MTIAIDASNIRTGGGITHLVKILTYADPLKFDVEKVIVYSNDNTLSKLPNFRWLVKKSDPWLNRGVLYSFLYQRIKLVHSLNEQNVDLLFVPGGTYFGSFRPFVTMSQNMLPFESEELNRFKRFRDRLKLHILRYTQSRTFLRSNAVIFLTQYAKEEISKKICLRKPSQIIPHGIDIDFMQQPKKQKEIKEYNIDNPFKLLYVSIINCYKHQWNVAEAVLKLREKGIPICLDLVGDYEQDSLNKLNKVIASDIYRCINYMGLIDHDKLTDIYKNADGFVFASSCENQPIILLEAMAAGLPIACSNKGPMPEVLGDAGIYFNPLSIDSIIESFSEFIFDKEKRTELSQKAYLKSLNYSWKDCSNQTFNYLAKIIMP